MSELVEQELELEPPSGEPLRFRDDRHGVKLMGVSFPKRTIELVVTPYETEALVEHQGRMISEVFSRGAYDGIERRANRIRANRDHEVSRTVGRAVALHPSREEGLVAEIRISDTPLGSETLTLADDGVLDASAGYRPMAGGEVWESRNRVRIRRAWLGHIALTPDPAYDAARVLAVRHAASEGHTDGPSVETPNLNVVRGWLLEDQLIQLDL